MLVILPGDQNVGLLLKPSHFPPECIFCGVGGIKWIRVRGERVKEYVTVFDREGGETVKRAAEFKCDNKLLTRISTYDLFACEAKYHKSCRKSYCWSYYLSRDKNHEAKEEQLALESSHRTATEILVKYINEHIVCNGEVVKLVTLRDVYIDALSNTDHPNPKYRSENVKNKIVKHGTVSGLVSLVKIQLKSSSVNIVYPNSISTADAITQAYLLAHEDKPKAVALELNQTVKTSHKF